MKNNVKNDKSYEQQFNTDDETLQRAIDSIRNGCTELEVQKTFHLSDDNMELIDFIRNEFYFF